MSWITCKGLRPELTVEEVYGIGLEQFVSELKDWPHVRCNSTKLEGEAIGKFVHVVEKV